MTGNAVRERLARLLAGRSGDAGTPALPDDSTREADSIRSQLRARRDRSASAPALRIAPPGGLDLDAERNVLARRTAHAPGHRHGDWELREGANADVRALALLARDPSIGAVDWSRAVYLDTETSGLSGGAGTWVFLIGLGRFAESVPHGLRFETWQGFLADPALEGELLHEAARRIREASAIVSFFGKSFDRHRLEDKMRVHGIEPPFSGRPHLDLYYPLRRLYRPRRVPGTRTAGPDGRLRTFELELCGVGRRDDLPGAFAPAAWFDFLHGRPHDLEGVFRHNQDDVLSLVTLSAHLSRTLKETRSDGSPLSGCGCARARAVASLHAEERDPEPALRWFERALERGAAPLTRIEDSLFRRCTRSGPPPATAPSDSGAESAKLSSR